MTYRELFIMVGVATVVVTTIPHTMHEAGALAVRTGIALHNRSGVWEPSWYDPGVQLPDNLDAGLRAGDPPRLCSTTRR